MATWTELLDKDPTGLLKQLTQKEQDPIKQHRTAVLKNIERSRKALADKKNKGGLYKRVEDFAQIEVRIGRDPVRTAPVNGKPFGMVPMERLPAFLDSFEQHVKSGGYDNELRHATGGTAAKQTAPRKTRNETPEQKAARTAKRMATLARKKAEAASNR